MLINSIQSIFLFKISETPYFLFYNAEIFLGSFKTSVLQGITRNFKDIFWGYSYVSCVFCTLLTLDFFYSQSKYLKQIFQ